jgi:2-oxoglutarate dehydrogenase E2 component (dihydrolipoamide succinyltransferase)
MATEIKVPTLGESVTEATIGRWFKKPGDAVRRDEPLVELETDKVTLEVNAPAAGVLGDIIAKDGETVGVGAVLGSIEDGAAAAPPQGEQTKSEQTRSEPAKLDTQSRPPRPASAATAAAARPAHPVTFMPPSPAAAKIAADRGLDPGAIEGSGRRGQVLKGDVLKGDVLAATDQPRPAPAPTPAPPPAAPPTPRLAPTGEDAGREERVRMTKLRQTIARRLKEAQASAAMLTTFNEVDMTNVMALRNQYKELFEKKHGMKLGFMSFFVKACTQALKEIPTVNAEIDGQDIIYKNYYHIGVAVGTDKGLVVPVIRDADRLSLAGIERTIADFGKRAREGQLKIEEMRGGTFTISNGGVYGSLMSTPILNAPQSAILGMHKIQERPVVVGGQIVARPMMYLAVSYDHRIIDGKEAVTFLVRVKESLEDPARLVLDL